MRVALVVYGPLSTTSGGFLYDRRLVAHLRDAGDAVDVIELPWRSYPRNLLDALDPGVRRRIEATAPADVLLQDELCHPSLALHNRRLDVDAPIVSIVHHLRTCEARSAPRATLYRAIERRYLRDLDGAIYGSRATRDAVEELAPGLTGTVAHPAGRFDSGIDPGRVEERAREPGPLRIVFLGNLVPRKGLHALLRGLSRLPGGEWRLSVIGDPTVDPRYVRRIRRIVDRRDLGERVDLAGRLPDDDLVARLAEAHLLAVPSRYEGFGIAYLEGMGFGLPPIASAAGGASELVTDGENGFLVPPEDPGAIARRIRPLLDDRDALARLGRAALRRYRAHPDWEESMARARTFIGEVAAAPP